MDRVSLTMTESASPHFALSNRIDAPVEQLPALLTLDLESCSSPALLWTAKRPRKNWFRGLTDHVALVLTTAPQFEQIVWLKPATVLKSPISFRNECHYLLNAYKELFELQTPVADCPALERYVNTLHRHILDQESTVFPNSLQSLPIERCLRELGYEHRGLEKGIARLPSVLRLSRQDKLSRKEREKFDLDFFHLLEHHLEREEKALYPALVHLDGLRCSENFDNRNPEKGVDTALSTCYNPSHQADPT